jgi:hypothetical protein
VKQTALLAAFLVSATSACQVVSKPSTPISVETETPNGKDLNKIDKSKRTYTTNFTATENPIAELGPHFTAGNWVNGGTTGLDWHNARTTANTLAFGTDCTGGQCGSHKYDDTVAVLGDGWRRDQSAQVTVYSTNAGANCNKEVEALVNYSVNAHSLTGYEFNANTRSGNPYWSIVKITGSNGSFSILVQGTLASAPRTGDTLRLTHINGVLSAYKNGVLIDNSQTDYTYENGAPGFGFYLENLSDTCTNSEFGITSFTGSEP